MRTSSRTSGGSTTTDVRPAAAGGNPYQIDAAEGAIVGLMAGAIGGVISAILSIPVQMVMGPIQQQWVERAMSQNPEMTPEVRDMVERMMLNSGVRVVSMSVTLPTCSDRTNCQTERRRGRASGSMPRAVKRWARSSTQACGVR